MTRPVDRNAERQDPQGLGPKDESDGALKAQAASIPYLAVGERQAIAVLRSAITDCDGSPIPDHVPVLVDAGDLRAILSLDSPSLGEGVRITDDLIAIGAKQMRAVVDEGGWDDETILGSALEAMGLAYGVKVATPATNASVAYREAVALSQSQSAALCRAAEFLDACAGEDMEVEGVTAISVVEDLQQEFLCEDQDDCFHIEVRRLLSLTKNVATNADMRGALEPFALISSEGIVKPESGYVTITTCAEYFHRARTVLQGDQS